MASRMNRDEFNAKVAPLDAEQLRKALWTLYWRGTAQVRERIEETLEPAREVERKRTASVPRPAEEVLKDVTRFVVLVRDGAYTYGDRRVHHTERSKWRVTFRALAKEAHAALHDEETAPAEEAMEQLIELAVDMNDGEYVHSEDPVEAARFVVSHSVSALWMTVREQHGFASFTQRAAPQLIRWESRWGWTRGAGQVAGNETSLAAVIGQMLATQQDWLAFAAEYLLALDAVAAKGPDPNTSRYRNADYERSKRADDLSEWNEMLVHALAEAGTAAEVLLDRLVKHPALAGSRQGFLQAVLAERRKDLVKARALVRECLERSPWDQEFAEFALAVGADLPPRADGP